MLPLSKLKFGFGSSRNITRRSGEFGDFDTIACPNSFADDPSIDQFFSQKNEKITGPTIRDGNSKIPPRDETIEVKFLPRPPARLSISKSFCAPEKKRTVSFCERKEPTVEVGPQREDKIVKSRTTAASIAESARKGIQKRSQSIREKIMPRRSAIRNKAIEPPPKKASMEPRRDEDVVPMTPSVPLVRPRSPPKTRHRRSGPQPPPPTIHTLVNPYCVYKQTTSVDVNQAEPRLCCLAGTNVLPKSNNPSKHIWGRWSLPIPPSLVEPIDPDDEDGEVKATPLHANPVRARQKLVEKNNDKKQVQTPTTKILRTNSMVITPKRKKSLVKGVRIQFDHRDTLRKLSLRKSMIVAQPQLTAIAKKPSLKKKRNPYAHIKSKVGEVFRSVLPKKDIAKCGQSMTSCSMNTTTISSVGNNSNLSAMNTSISSHTSTGSRQRVPSRSRKSPSITSPPEISRNPNPPNKTLAELVKDFHRTPPRFRSRPVDRFSGKKTVL